jgi:rhamnosyltransferase
MAHPPASVIVRCKNESSTVGRTLELLRAQSVRPEIVFVDSGSTDGSLEIGRDASDRLVQLAPEEFSYGRALNAGAAAASAPVHMACSAHCFPSADWVERSLVHYERADVAGTNGIQTFADRTPVTSVFYQDWQHARADVDWGFSNHASSWRADVWEQFPFDEQLDYAEDREWSWRVMRAGWVIAFDPRLWISMSHSWQSAPDLFQRRRRAARALRTFASMPAYGGRQLAHEWWYETPEDGKSLVFHRVNYRRMAGLLGKYVGSREAPAREP